MRVLINPNDVNNITSSVTVADPHSAPPEQSRRLQTRAELRMLALILYHRRQEGKYT